MLCCTCEAFLTFRGILFLSIRSAWLFALLFCPEIISSFFVTANSPLHLFWSDKILHNPNRISGYFKIFLNMSNIISDSYMDWFSSLNVTSRPLLLPCLKAIFMHYHATLMRWFEELLEVSLLTLRNDASIHPPEESGKVCTSLSWGEKLRWWHV